MSNVVALFPAAEALPDPAPTLNLKPAEVEAAAGGYKRPGDQLRELHARGFTRAYISKPTGKVVLERAHYDAVTRGQFGAASNEPKVRAPVRPDAAGLRAFLSKRKGG